MNRQISNHSPEARERYFKRYTTVVSVSAGSVLLTRRLVRSAVVACRMVRYAVEVVHDQDQGKDRADSSPCRINRAECGLLVC